MWRYAAQSLSLLRVCRAAQSTVVVLNCPQEEAEHAVISWGAAPQEAASPTSRDTGRRGDERYVSTIMAVRGKQSGRSNVAGSLGPTPFLTPIIEPVAAVSGMA